MDTLRNERACKYDTMRFCLLFLVIVGHEMELFLGGRVLYLYKIIYSFHMPAFMYLTGKFAKFDKKRILKHLCLPYVVFQTLYLCFSCAVLTGNALKIQYTTPYWILWYLLAVIFCYAIIPLLPEKESPWAIPVVLASFAVSILVGFDSTIGYYLTLSRFFVFLPFFLWGYYQETLERFIKKRIDLKRTVSVVLSLIVIVIGEYVIIRRKVPINLLYGSYGYAASESSAIARCVVLITAIGWIRLLCSVVPNTPIPLVSAAGRNTMPVFILHAFVVKLLGKIGFFHYPQKVNLLLACLISVALIGLFGNRYVAKAFRKIF